MAYTIKIQNSLDEVLQLYPSEDYMLSSITGITPADAVINATEMATQDGAHFNSSRVMPRNLVIAFAVRGEGTDVRQRRVALYRYIKPKHPIRVYLSNDQRDVYIDGYVETLQDAGTIFTGKEMLQVSVICPDPYFKDNETGERTISFSSITSMFYFPFSIVSPIPFSQKDEALTKSIVNDGDTACGVTLKVAAHGNVSDPWFYNETSGETMSFDIDLVSGDELIISTVQGHKSAKLWRSGTESNVINTLAQGSDWVTLEPGSNTFYYNADSGVSNMSLTFTYNILFEGI